MGDLTELVCLWWMTSLEMRWPKRWELRHVRVKWAWSRDEYLVAVAAAKGREAARAGSLPKRCEGVE